MSAEEESENGSAGMLEDVEEGEEVGLFGHCDCF